MSREAAKPPREEALREPDERSEILASMVALPALGPVHLAQVISYLKATGLALGLLVNFGERHLRTGCRRVVLTR